MICGFIPTVIQNGAWSATCPTDFPSNCRLRKRTRDGYCVA
jgi:hypothetical protein